MTSVDLNELDNDSERKNDALFNSVNVDDVDDLFSRRDIHFDDLIVK